MELFELVNHSLLYCLVRSIANVQSVRFPQLIQPSFHDATLLRSQGSGWYRLLLLPSLIHTPAVTAHTRDNVLSALRCIYVKGVYNPFYIIIILTLH